MTDIIKIIVDRRPILKALSESEEVGAIVGFPSENPVTKIEPYWEIDEGAAHVWLAVFKGDNLVARLNVSKMAEIAYE